MWREIEIPFAVGIFSKPRDYTHAGAIITPSHQCLAKSKSQAQCRLKTRNGLICWVHTHFHTGVQIKPSAIPEAGRGLFATRDFPVGTEVARYTGDLVSTLAGVAATDDSMYIYQMRKRPLLLVDAARQDTASGRNINDARGLHVLPNTKTVLDPRNKIFHTVTTELVSKGQEFLLSYGDEY